MGKFCSYEAACERLKNETDIIKTLLADREKGYEDMIAASAAPFQSQQIERRAGAGDSSSDGLVGSVFSFFGGGSKTS
jgi:hypothetical protein